MELCKIILSLLCVATLVANINGENVLVVVNMAAYSHYSLGNKLMHIMAGRGHNVTIIASYKDKNLPSNCREIYLSGLEEQMEELKKEVFGKNKSKMSLSKIPFMIEMGVNTTRYTLTHPAVKKLLADPKEQFDLVVIEEFLNQPLKIFGYIYDAPIVSFSPVGANVWLNKITGNPNPVSYVPDGFMAVAGTMTFWQRVTNVFMSFLFQGFDYFMTKAMDNLIDELYPIYPHIDELNDLVSIVLINSHTSVGQPVPLLPNMIEIGGYHVDPPKPLPKDLQKYMDESKKGVIYFSLGSNMKSKFLPNETLNAIMKAFAKVDMDILWKFEDPELPGKPKNVKISKWVPQQDVLAHPNLKVFITHGGLLSTIETIYYGIPAIGIAVGADQHANVAKAVASGYAVEVNLETLTEESLYGAIMEILENPRYAEIAQNRSVIMHDRIVSPELIAAYWMEYAMRHKGEKHFRSAAKDLAWYQLSMLDIIAFLLLIVLVTGFVVRKLYRAICRKLCSKNSNSTKLKTKRE